MKINLNFLKEKEKEINREIEKKSQNKLYYKGQEIALEEIREIIKGKEDIFLFLKHREEELRKIHKHSPNDFFLLGKKILYSQVRLNFLFNDVFSEE